ncbi:MAG: Asp-tRNA(Asn)/Glu-tRNA(Gln) amidotransferase subunit GatB [Gemmatimonadetes bacterium]|nr:Asp-tRNA(Asn)/Glu-tRNA(Gln) amidotransferase subunit GatB [Gemmatimonadota bacterium]
MNWETVIGLEVHVQLKTRSKMFCACSTSFGDPPNTHVCPVCLGLPGALPLTNREAIRLSIGAALALQFDIHDRSVFSRKNYFYPDLPKGYQISQFDRPLATAGRLAIASAERGSIEIGITRLHLEEDAGKSFHDRVPGMTAVDLNRSGVPLAEIVSEPDLRSPAEARAYLVTLKQILEYVGVSDCNMEEGSLRVDGNLSVRRPGEPKLGTKQEVKNMNSFAAVEKSLGLLRDQQIAVLERGGKIELTTFSASSGELRAMRTKEESHDYRYFPEPDLPVLLLSAFGLDVGTERTTLPELPAARQGRFVRDYGLSAYDASVLSATRSAADRYEQIVKAGADPKTAANLLLNAPGKFADSVTAGVIAEVSNAVHGDLITIQNAFKLIPELETHQGSFEELARTRGMLKLKDAGEVDAWIASVLEAHPGEVERYKQGEAKLLGFLMGAVMKQSKGRADPKLVQSALKEKLGA